MNLFSYTALVLVCLCNAEDDYNHGFYRDCSDLYRVGFKKSEVYTIQFEPYEDEVKVYCDMHTNGGGWTVFQRRLHGFVDFYRGWDDYAEGFGNLRGEFWLGNHNLYQLTKQKHFMLRVELEDFEQQKRYAEYRFFAVGAPFQKYKLEIGGYSGNAGDALSYHAGMGFVTKDADRNTCSAKRKGGWWYNSCYRANLNALYHGGHFTSGTQDGVAWNTWRGNAYSLKFVEMKIRPVHFKY